MGTSLARSVQSYIRKAVLPIEMALRVSDTEEEESNQSEEGIEEIVDQIKMLKEGVFK